jgi:asparagine synthase (glutamine-hydrolysing)
VQAASGLLRHRGPDGEGYAWIGIEGDAIEFKGADSPESLDFLPLLSPELLPRRAGVLLGHRRLSILDTTSAGHQPMKTSDGRLWITFNGEVYNYRELREELGGFYEFSTGSDTEVVLAAWLVWGKECVRKFVGMFAFVLVDCRAANPSVYMVRDPFGIKPLYWASLDGDLLFASEIKGLFAMGLKAVGNGRRLLPYLNNGTTDFGDETLFEGIYQLPSGSRMLVNWRGGHLSKETERYWAPRPGSVSSLSISEAAEAIRAIFVKNIGLHLRSDVPIGAALSGGIDSSGIVGGMRGLNPEVEINAFSYVAGDEKLSEERWMDLVAREKGIVQHKVYGSPDRLSAAVEDLVYVQDEPFGSTSIFVQYEVFRASAEAGVKVMLDGQGADELFAGYYGYGARRAETLIRRLRFLEAISFIRSSTEPGLLSRMIYGFLPDSARLLAKRFSKRGGGLKAVRRGWLTDYSGLNEWGERASGADRLRMELSHSISTSSLPMLLRYEDRNSMAHSVESRVPFLTVEMAELALSLPEEIIFSEGGYSKHVLRQALKGLVPESILSRRDKIGFATPEGSWLKALTPWVTEQFCEASLERVPFLDGVEVRRQWQDFLNGKAHFDHRFWRWCNLAVWARQHEVCFRA